MSSQRDAQLDGLALIGAITTGDQHAARAVLDLCDQRAVCIELAVIIKRWLGQDFPGDEQEVLAVMRAAVECP